MRAVLTLGLMAAMAGPAAADTRLAEVAARRDFAAVTVLVAQKLDVNTPGVDGTPALHWAVRVDDLDMARLLVGAGADAKLANGLSLTPLALATSNGNPARMRLLLDAGADPNAVDPANETMLMMASKVGAWWQLRDEGFAFIAPMESLTPDDHPESSAGRPHNVSNEPRAKEYHRASALFEG